MSRSLMLLLLVVVLVGSSGVRPNHATAAGAMATNYNVSKTGHHTLVALTVDVLTFTQTCGTFVVFNRGAASDIYMRMDGTNPTVAGDDTYFIPPNQDRRFSPPDAGNAVVRLISAGTPPYSLECEQ